MTERVDLLLRGGRVLDPASGRDGPADVAVRDGRLVPTPTDADLSPLADRVIDVEGLVVVPGFVDLHAHVFRGHDLGVDPDAFGARSGITTFVDTGTAGGHLFDAFAAGTIERARSRILAFVNISSIGATSILLAGELENLAYCDVAVCCDAIRRHGRHVLGVKVRSSGNVVGRNGLEPFRRALAAAEQAGTPLMVHIGPEPPDVEAMLEAMRPGDVLTHCHTGHANRLVVDGRLREAAVLARERGVLFDVGHGMGSFDVGVAAAMLERGFLPDTISTDIHAYSESAVVDLPHVLSKFLALGMSLPDVVARATTGPAAAIGRADGTGTLQSGAAADVVVLEEVHAPQTFTDTAGATFTGDVLLRTWLTVRAGDVVFDRIGEERARP